MTDPHAPADLVQPLRILFASAEVAPFAKTGGLADVVGALPRALAERGHECVVVMPLYNCCKRAKQPLEQTPHRFPVPFGSRSIEAGVWKSTLPDSDVPVYFIEQPGFFERDNPAHGSGIYQYRTSDGGMADYADNGPRYIFFCRAVLELFDRIDFRPDVVHANDWMTGLLPVYLRSGVGLRQYTPPIRSVFTIHNVAYQGNIHKDLLPLTGLGWDYFTHDRLEFHDQLSMMKGGIVFADAVNTVSPRYALEIQTPEFAYGLEQVLRSNRDKLSGIVNGVDYAEWDPAGDRRLPVRYSLEDVLAGKAANKAALQQRVRLLPVPSRPVIGMITRLAEQKGLDLLQSAAWELMRENIQLVILGTGESHLHQFLASLGARYPQQASVILDFNADLAHLIEAGSDMFLMPSKYEPCGLNQLYSLRYGTVPIVRETGGLADTVVDANPENLEARTATGFHFRDYDATGMLWAIRRALRLYHGQPALWHQLQRTGMSQDWSWARSARDYEALYRSILA